MNLVLKTLFTINLFASVMILAILAVSFILKGKVHNKIICFLWLLVLARLVIPITLESPVHLDALFPQTQAVEKPPVIEANITEPVNINSTPITTIDDSEILYTPPIKPNIDTQDTSYEPVPYVEPAPPSFFEQAFDVIKSISIWTYMLVVWAIGVIILVTRALVEYLRFKHRVNPGRRINDQITTNIATECKAALGLDKDVRIITSRYVRTPVTFGFVHPIVLLPVGISHKLGEHKLRMVILHELCHIKRKDIFINYLWLVAKVVSWFNPFIYIAYKQHLHAIEIACDEMVLKNIGMDDSFNYSESLLDVLRISRSQKVVPVALSFCQDKTKIRKRVENMIRPQRKLKSAGFISILLTVVMVVGCFTTACQPAKAEDKEPSPTENTILDNTPDSTTDKTFSLSKIPSHVDKVLSPKTENVSVKFDAYVKVPESTAFPIVELVPAKMTQEQVDKFVDTFFPERANITAGWLEENKPYTKEEIKEQIALREKYIKNTKKLIPKDCKGKSVSIPKWEKEIEHFKEFLKDAPNDESQFPDVTKFASTLLSNRLLISNPEYYASELVEVKEEEKYNIKHIDYSFSNNNSTYYVRAHQSDSPFPNSFQFCMSRKENHLYNNDSISENYDDIPELETSYSEAKKIADKATDVLGLHDMDLYKASNYNNDYCFIYTWDVEGTNVTYTSGFYSPSHFSIAIDDSGIVCANYSSPAEYKSTLPVEFELMPFENIMEKAYDTFNSEDYLNNRFALNLNDYDLEVKKYNVVIEKVELGYRMHKSNDEDGIRYTLMPVWEFFGREDYDLTYYYNRDGRDETDHRNHRDEYCTTKSILTITATRGQVIGQHLNYFN